MHQVSRVSKLDYPLMLGMVFLTLFGTLALRSTAEFLFPMYFVFIFISFLAFFIFAHIDFDIISLFSKHFYVGSLLFLLLPLFIGQVSRGAVRWIPVGALTVQPAELVRPFLLVFFANFLVNGSKDIKTIFKSLILLSIPVGLILIQPSLGVAVLTVVSFIGVLLASGFSWKYYLSGFIGLAVLVPILFFLLAPYQQQRVVSFLDPSKDPLGTGYNSIQSMISVGSGMFFGRGLGEGGQTQLAFLPERHTDFIFASVGEEMGIVGAALLLLGSFFILFRIIKFIENSRSPTARAYLAGLFLTLFVQVFVNIGMNLGLLPITGLPLPLVSAGGSSLLATMIGLGIAVGAREVK